MSAGSVANFEITSRPSADANDVGHSRYTVMFNNDTQVRTRLLGKMDAGSLAYIITGTGRKEDKEKGITADPFLLQI